MQKTPNKIVLFFQSRINSIKISGVDIFLLISLLVFGSIAVFLTPIGGGYDEDQHLIRVWELSDFVWVPQEMSAKKARYPEIFFQLSYRRQPLVEPIMRDFWKKNAGRDLYDEGYHYGGISTRSVYSPPLLIPQAVAMRYFGRRENLPVLSVYYACRFAGLLSYLLLAWLALRLIPYHKWLFLVLAISPAAIYQASTISADSISNGIGLLFIAGCLAIHEKKDLDWKEVGWLTLLIFMLFLSKINLALLALLPFILILPGRFKSRFLYYLLIAASIILFVIEIIGWNMLASSSIPLIARDGISLSGQLQHILSSPFGFLQTIINDLSIHGLAYLYQWMGAYGYEYGSVPALTYIFFLFGIGLALLLEPESQRPDIRTRIILLIFFLLTYLATLGLFYFTITAVGEKFVYGVQGRYFISTAPLLFLAISGLFSVKRFRITGLHVTLCSAVASIIFVAGIFLSFHVVCGSTYYNRGLCYQPFYKNYSPLLRSTEPISNETVLVQEIAPTCNGLTLIQVRINYSNQDENGKTEFVVRDEYQKVVRNITTVQNNTLSEDAWYVIKFQPDWSSNGKLYTLTIRGIGGQTGMGPLVAYSVRPEYLAGALYQNGTEVDDDVIFQYGCVAGLSKALRFFDPK